MQDLEKLGDGRPEKNGFGIKETGFILSDNYLRGTTLQISGAENRPVCSKMNFLNRSIFFRKVQPTIENNEEKTKNNFSQLIITIKWLPSLLLFLLVFASSLYKKKAKDL